MLSLVPEVGLDLAETRLDLSWRESNLQLET